MKSFNKKSTKAKVGIIAFILFMIVLVAYVLYSTFKPEPPVEYDIVKVNHGSITDSLDVSGTVESGVSEMFTAIQGVRVEEVFVSVGDNVSKGDKLATFNVSSVAEYLTNAKKDYDKALNDYKDAKNKADTNAKKKAELDSAIETKKSEIESLQNEVNTLQSELENTDVITEKQLIPQEQVDEIAQQMRENGATEDQINEFISSASSVLFPEASIDTSKPKDFIQKSLKLSQLKSELSSLQAEAALVIVTDESILDAFKSVADTKKIAYESVKQLYDSMKNGWYAQNNGVVTAVNIMAGQEFVPVVQNNSQGLDISALLGIDPNATQMLGSMLNGGASVPTGVGILIESYEDMMVTVTVGKSDLLKIKTGMSATVLSLGSEYEGEVVYVGATATQSSGLDLGSLMGTSSGAAGAIVKVKIKNPDEKIVIGFDVDIKINLSKSENVIMVPVECVMYDNGEYSVFVYDSETSEITRRIITKGTLDDTNYEIVSGLVSGEMVVKSPDPNMTDGTKIADKNA